MDEYVTQNLPSGISLKPGDKGNFIGNLTRTVRDSTDPRLVAGSKNFFPQNNEILNLAGDSKDEKSSEPTGFGLEDEAEKSEDQNPPPGAMEIENAAKTEN